MGEERKYRVTLSPEHRQFDARAGESVLDAALNAGINLPHSCKGGSCGACRARVNSGEVAYPFGRPLGITDEEEAQGYTLLCEAHALSDLNVDIREVRVAADVVIRNLPCRIVRRERLAPDVMGLFLQLPAVEPFAFLPGQYLDILLSDGRRRSFSIASPPHDCRPLELHVRRAPGGEFSQWLFDSGDEKSLLRIEGPLGQFYYQAPLMRASAAPGDVDASPPALLIGGGTGFAPLKSIIRHVLEKRLPRRLHLYWGARTRADLYEHALVRQWAAAHDNFAYTAVLSEATERDSWTGRTGLVHAAALQDYPDLSAADVYACGPPALIEAVKRDGFARGLAPERLYFDSFEYAPDSLHKMHAQKK